MLHIKAHILASLSLLGFLAACTSASPTIQFTQPAETIPPAETQPATQTPPPATLVPSATPLPLGGSGEILFASDREGAYLDLYLLNTTSGDALRLTVGDSNTFPGPYGPDGRMLFTGFGPTTSYVGVRNTFGSEPIDLSQHPEFGRSFSGLVAGWDPNRVYFPPGWE